MLQTNYPHTLSCRGDWGKVSHTEMRQSVPVGLADNLGLLWRNLLGYCLGYKCGQCLLLGLEDAGNFLANVWGKSDCHSSKSKRIQKKNCTHVEGFAIIRAMETRVWIWWTPCPCTQDLIRCTVPRAASQGAGRTGDSGRPPTCRTWISEFYFQVFFYPASIDSV